MERERGERGRRGREREKRGGDEDGGGVFKPTQSHEGAGFSRAQRVSYV